MASNKEVPMHRHAALLLCALVAVSASVMAAPAPFPRAGQKGPWFDGWDRPEGPVNDCRFDRKGDRLTITVPGKNHAIDDGDGHLNAPRLMREVAGDFLLQVRVTGNWRRPAKGYDVARHAGLLLDCQGDFKLRITTGLFASVVLEGGRASFQYVPRLSIWRLAFPLVEKRTLEGLEGDWAVWIRLERRGKVLRLTYSLDGKKWKALGAWAPNKLPPKLKVGVVALSTAKAEDSFKAVFDQFKLTPLAGQTQ
jgi:regulation of enolase protein 1 (concanavalin A-like superfamily)